MAMEYFGRGDLTTYIERGLSEIEAKEIVEDVTRGLQVMHTEGFTHRDIKPQVRARAVPISHGSYYVIVRTFL